ncbi:MAG TPA: hypothetical protein VFQ80_13345, partial [Thermomicrobiales bacterium]|nr:hypothetical protein [Thermomicrobiales bacterium]
PNGQICQNGVCGSGGGCPNGQMPCGTSAACCAIDLCVNNGGVEVCVGPGGDCPDGRPKCGGVCCLVGLVCARVLGLDVCV